MRTAICVAKTTAAGVIIYGNKATVRRHNTIVEDYSKPTTSARNKANTARFVKELLACPEIKVLTSIIKSYNK